MDQVRGWTGETACVLQAALRLSNEAFAEHLGIGVRTVAAWHQKPSLRPRPEMQQLLDTALGQAPEPARARFAALTGDPAQAGSQSHQYVERPDDHAVSDAERRLSTDPAIRVALDRLDEHIGWEPGTARRQVASRLVRLDAHQLQDRASMRGRIRQPHFAEALGSYYRDPVNGYGRYSARYGPGTEILTSVLTHPDWLDLDCPLTTACDRLTLTDVTADRDMWLDEKAADAAAQRLAEILVTGTQLVDMPLYRLLDVNVRKGEIAGALGVTYFVRYALTMDLLEGELTDALTAGRITRPGSLPLRDRYLPDLESVLALSGRLCAGGALALCAFARPNPYRGPADYVLLIQERSGSVVNAAHRLAVIPKGFHQPMADFRTDARIGATLRREIEEELFGREDVDNTVTEQHAADPMHPSRLSEPMRWLMGNPGLWKMECTGFGLNLISGNFEFACLIVVDSEDFWLRYGGQIEANWESMMLREYSSLDGESIAELAQDPAWSNEGLFALLQGLRHLKHVGGNRVDLPAIEWEIQQ